MNIKYQQLFAAVLSLTALIPGAGAVMAQSAKVAMVDQIDNQQPNTFYISNKAPLKLPHLIKLPVGSITAGGWLKKALELQRDGLTGNLGEISIWLSKTNNAWLNKEGKGEYGWEELPYWLKGYANIGYMLGDQKMIAESQFWIDAVLNNQRNNGDFGPDRKKKGNRDLWTNMPMLWCLQSYYEYSGDPRVIPFMTKYFNYELSVPDDQFLKDYWEKSRGGDNLSSVYWLYNRTGDASLLKLAAKIDQNTADWRQADSLPNWHNVNVAQGFREPATFYLQSHDSKDLGATYHDFSLIRNLYGQMPGGMFAADENARKGYGDPRQAVETCGMVEQMTSDQMLLATTGDCYWAENCEDVAFNTFPAAFMPDYKSLRYLTAANMVLSDGKNHNPGIDNNGPFLMMNPFSSRCCQHNHAAGWVYYAENSWMATPDNGVAALLYTQGQVNAKVGDGTAVKITETTHYPFADQVNLLVNTPKTVTFPLYLRVPAWCKAASVKINGRVVKVDATNGHYLKISNSWKNGDQIALHLPMQLTVRQWANNKNSISINYGPLTYSLKIEEQYLKKESTATATGDSRWQAGANPEKWPSYEIHPTSAWNYGLIVDKAHLKNAIQVIKRKWPKDDNPFTNNNTPIELKVKGKEIASWTIDQYGLCGLLPQSPVKTSAKATQLTLVPMGGARLRIAAFPEIE